MTVTTDAAAEAYDAVTPSPRSETATAAAAEAETEAETEASTDASSATDAALARRAGLGDEAAFTELFHRHFQASFRFAVNMLRQDEDEAAEAAQNAWVKAWRNLPDFRGDARFQTWLLSIVSREVFDHRRRRRPLLVDDSALEAHGHTSPEGDDPASGVVERELWETLTIALDELPWRQKACWLLREMDGLSYDETAQVLGTTPTVVRGQLFRARRALALRMEQWR